MCEPTHARGRKPVLARAYAKCAKLYQPYPAPHSPLPLCVMVPLHRATCLQGQIARLGDSCLPHTFSGPALPCRPPPRPVLSEGLAQVVVGPPPNGSDGRQRRFSPLITLGWGRAEIPINTFTVRERSQSRAGRHFGSIPVHVAVKRTSARFPDHWGPSHNSGGAEAKLQVRQSVPVAVVTACPSILMICPASASIHRPQNASSSGTEPVGAAETTVPATAVEGAPRIPRAPHWRWEFTGADLTETSDVFYCYL